MPKNPFNTASFTDQLQSHCETCIIIAAFNHVSLCKNSIHINSILIDKIYHDLLHTIRNYILINPYLHIIL